MNRIIFLDIDGVIATQKTIIEGSWGLTPQKQDLLGYIIEKTDAKIVLSSSWRKSTLEASIEYMRENGFRFCDKIIGVTIRAYHYIEKGIHLSIPRGVEIKQWIDTHIHSDNGHNFERKKIGIDWNYVILDDDTDMLLEQRKYFIRTHYLNGISKSQSEKAIRLLLFSACT